MKTKPIKTSNVMRLVERSDMLSKQHPHLESAGAVPAGTMVSVVAKIPPRNIMKLRERVSKINGMTLRQRAKAKKLFLTHKQYLEQHAPHENAFLVIEGHFRDTHGLKVERLNHCMVRITGPVELVSAALGTKIEFFTLLQNVEGKTKKTKVISVTSAPQLPANVSRRITTISGVSSSIGVPSVGQYRSRLVRPGYNKSDRPKNQGDPYTLVDLATMYNSPTHMNKLNPGTLSGKGAKATIVGANAVNEQAAQKLFKENGVTTTGKFNVIQEGGSSDQPEAENDLDNEQLRGLAFGADVDFHTAVDANDDHFMVSVQHAVDGNPDVLSQSWGESEDIQSDSDRQANNHMTMQLIAQGGNWFAASGDDGPYDNKENPKKKSADNPASDPNVIGCGGEEVVTNDNGSRKSAQAWDGAGGWISKFFSREAFQTGMGLPPTTGKGAVTKRLSADICSVASLNPGIAYISGAPGQEEEDAAGGTSFAAPRLAGWFCLLMEALGLKRPGNLLPILYSILRSDQYKQVFFDVTEGEATGGGNGPGLPATEGWDHPTGMGALNDAALIDLIVKLHNGTAKLTFNGERARKRKAEAAKATARRAKAAERARTRHAAARKAA